MRGTVRQYRFDIAGTIYGPESEISHSVSNGLYEEFGIGNASSADLRVSLCANSIPRGAVIKRYIRLVNEDAGLTSEWLPKGVFYTNRRSEDDGRWTIYAFDAMRRTERVWVPFGDESAFPMTMEAVAYEIAEQIGVRIDKRTRLNPEYTIDEYPYDNDYSLRDMLRFIAAAHAGNWIMTDVGELLLVPLFSAPSETGYLVTEYGAAITLGGVRLIVNDGSINQSSAARGNFEKHYAGLDLTGLEKNSIQSPVTKVTLTGVKGGDISAGDDSGMELKAECPYATQEMVNNIIADIYDAKYEMYSADDTNIDPAFELGDGVTVGNIYSVIARYDDDGSGFPSLSQPGKAEMEDEYPYTPPEKRKRIQLEKKVDELESKFDDYDSRFDDINDRIDNLTIESGGVISFNGRTGEVVPEVGDYTPEISEAIQYAIYASWEAEY